TAWRACRICWSRCTTRHRPTDPLLHAGAARTDNQSSSPPTSILTPTRGRFYVALQALLGSSRDVILPLLHQGKGDPGQLAGQDHQRLGLPQATRLILLVQLLPVALARGRQRGVVQQAAYLGIALLGQLASAREGPRVLGAYIQPQEGDEGIGALKRPALEGHGQGGGGQSADALHAPAALRLLQQAGRLERVVQAVVHQQLDALDALEQGLEQ